MKMILIGPGRIGSTFCFYLSRAGHDVAVLARGVRLDELRREGAIIATDGRRAPVQVVSAMDVSVAYDLVMVTVLPHQIDALIPTLSASASKCILFMFNTFESTTRWREALGSQRFEVGFPNMAAFFEGGKLHSVVDGPGMVTTLTSATLARQLKAAGMPTEVESDIDSYLRSHVAFVVPLMVAAQWTWKRNFNLSWSEARRLSDALREGFALVRVLGHSIKPGYVAFLSRLPSAMQTALLWGVSRTDSVKKLGAFGPDEVRTLIDAMTRAGPDRTASLRSIRP
jgi:2-dehydropantoate 2-reductase